MRRPFLQKLLYYEEQIIILALLNDFEGDFEIPIILPHWFYNWSLKKHLIELFFWISDQFAIVFYYDKILCILDQYERYFLFSSQGYKLNWGGYLFRQIIIKYNVILFVQWIIIVNVTSSIFYPKEIC